MTFNFEPSLPDRWPSLRSYIAHRAAKYKDTDEARKARVLNKVETMLPELMALLGNLKGVA